MSNHFQLIKLFRRLLFVLVVEAAKKIFVDINFFLYRVSCEEGDLDIQGRRKNPRT